ncbi:MAG: alpha-galactosidase [Lachnospiraceae bacterium]|nr:alpha-galactosidase [Lachnospiraceae bacterium]
MIEIIEDKVFFLHTPHTSYVFRVLPTGQLEHLYYGRRLHFPAKAGKDVEKASDGMTNSTEDIALSMIGGLTEKHAFAPGNVNVYDEEHKEYSLEDMRLEMSALGKGDIREPFIEVVHADGSYTSDFCFQKAEATKGKLPVGKAPFRTLPGSYDETGRAEHLCVTLRDEQYGLTLMLHYTVYEDCDVITRSARLVNDSDSCVTLKRLMSAQLDFDMPGYVFTTFHGAWAREMQRDDVLVSSGKYVNASYTGTSSSRSNPFCMLHPAQTTEDYGDCYGCNLIYSGNHMEVVEVNSFGKTRFVSGINPQSFAWELAPGEDFEAPEAVLAYSHEGFNGMSRRMHRFVREHIVRGEWKKKTRPVLLNSWEAAYFDINEHKLLKLAKAGKELGIELFVMDDGWFGKRDDDSSSLGDWEVNTKKLPGGLAGLCDKVKALGLDFGIWVEPEMVNVDSNLFRAHPDWVLQIPGKPHSEGRNQRILDLTNQAVQDFIIEKMTEVFSSADISYVKWDMNRTFTDYYSQSLPSDKQGEVAHRYVCGLYRCMDELTKRFPHILFEGCAAGGNRFDLGILCYFPQIWASDDTDALCRTSIQTGYSYGYPMSTVTAHVSACPNHQTLRTTPLETRFNVAAFGVLGYECNFCDMKKEELAAVKAQIELYKQWREVLQWGDFYRGRVFRSLPTNSVSCAGTAPIGSDEGNLAEWTCVSPDGGRAVGFLMQRLAVPNSTFHTYFPKGLRSEQLYHFYNRVLKYDVRNFGDLVNTVSPIHLKADSLMLDMVAKFVKMDGETEDFTAYGDALMYGGVHLKQSFGGTGYNEQVRYFQDFGSRIYFMEQV